MASIPKKAVPTSPKQEKQISGSSYVQQQQQQSQRPPISSSQGAQFPLAAAAATRGVNSAPNRSTASTLLTQTPSPSPSPQPNSPPPLPSASNNNNNNSIVNDVETPGIPKFSSRLESALQEMLPSEDPLDAPTFDPIAYINKQFPDESSLIGGKLDAFLSSLRRKTVVLNESTTRDVRDHSCARVQTSQAIQSASVAIQELFQRIKAIKAKAAESELMVQNICRDIKSLDAAKKHLTNTIRALRNLHMLVSAVGQLDVMLQEKEYRHAAKLFKAIGDLFSLFKDYDDVPKIRVLRASVEETKSTIKKTLFQDFDRYLVSPQVTQEPIATQMADACAIIDVLDHSTKTELLSDFCSKILEEYVALYSYGKEGGTLELIERRYNWLRMYQPVYNERYLKIFPKHWEVPVYLAKEFCRLTRSHIQRMLSASAPKIDMNAMIKALSKTIDFEREFTRLYKPKNTTAKDENNNNEEVDEEYARDQEVERIKNKHRKEGQQSNGDSSSSESATQPLQGHDFSNAISDVFTPYMSGYVEMEKKNIDELLVNIESKAVWRNPLAEENKGKDRFVGSDELFQYIKMSVQRCSKLTKNVTFYNLFQEYVRGVIKYCDILTRRLPATSQSSQSSSDSTASISLRDPNQVTVVCFIVNTAAYCNELVSDLGESIKNLIDQEFKEKIDVESANNAYSALINNAISILVANLLTSLNSSLSRVKEYKWESWVSVEDESEYVKECDRILRSSLPVIGQRLSNRYHSTFYNNLASSFIPVYINAIYSCKKGISEMGAQQMNLDAQVLKKVLLAVPQYADLPPPSTTIEEKARATGVKMYSKFVQSNMSKVEALLKTLVSPNERLIVTFKALMPGASVEELQKIMSLRGLKKADIDGLVKAYNASVPQEDQIQPFKTSSGFFKRLLN